MERGKELRYAGRTDCVHTHWRKDLPESDYGSAGMFLLELQPVGEIPPPFGDRPKIATWQKPRTLATLALDKEKEKKKEQNYG